MEVSTTKIVSTAFHLYNKKAQREFNIFVNGQMLPFCAEPTYLGIQLNRTLTFCRHLESLRKKLTSRVGLLKRLAGSSWGANATILRTAILAMVYTTVEYCAPVWCCSARTRLIDKPINDDLRIVTRFLRPTLTNNFFISSDIQPTEPQKAIFTTL